MRNLIIGLNKRSTLIGVVQMLAKHLKLWIFIEFVIKLLFSIKNNNNNNLDFYHKFINFNIQHFQYNMTHTKVNINNFLNLTFVLN